jgi:hypothetical protein
MNIAVKIVSQDGIVPWAPTCAMLPSGSRWPLQNAPTTCGPERVWRANSAQFAPECVSEYGIAPYLNTSCVSGPLMNEPPCRIAR